MSKKSSFLYISQGKGAADMQHFEVPEPALFNTKLRTINPQAIDSERIRPSDYFRSRQASCRVDEAYLLLHRVVEDAFMVYNELDPLKYKMMVKEKILEIEGV